MAIIMSSDSDELSRSSPITVDYTDSGPDSPMPSNVSSVNSNSFIANKDKKLSSSANFKTSFVSTNSELNYENVVNKPSIPFSITSILNKGDPDSKYSKPDPNSNIGSVLNSRPTPAIVSSTSLIPTVFGGHLTCKQNRWYPWATSSGGMGGEALHPSGSSHPFLFRECRDSGKVFFSIIQQY